MRIIRILHTVVETMVLAAIAAAMFAVITVDFKVLGGLAGTLMTVAQIITCLTCIPGGLQVKRSLDSLFEWVEEKFEEMTEE